MLSGHQINAIADDLATNTKDVYYAWGLCYIIDSVKLHLLDRLPKAERANWKTILHYYQNLRHARPNSNNLYLRYHRYLKKPTEADVAWLQDDSDYGTSTSLRFAGMYPMRAYAASSMSASAMARDPRSRARLVNAFQSLNPASSGIAARVHARRAAKKGVKVKDASGSGSDGVYSEDDDIGVHIPDWSQRSVSGPYGNTSDMTTAQIALPPDPYGAQIQFAPPGGWGASDDPTDESPLLSVIGEPAEDITRASIQYPPRRRAASRAASPSMSIIGDPVEDITRASIQVPPRTRTAPRPDDFCMITDRGKVYTSRAEWEKKNHPQGAMIAGKRRVIKRK